MVERGLLPWLPDGVVPISRGRFVRKVVRVVEAMVCGDGADKELIVVSTVGPLPPEGFGGMKLGLVVMPAVHRVLVSIAGSRTFKLAPLSAILLRQIACSRDRASLSSLVTTSTSPLRNPRIAASSCVRGSTLDTFSWDAPPEVGFAMASPLEGDGFEPWVPFRQLGLSENPGRAVGLIFAVGLALRNTLRTVPLLDALAHKI
jgi:hypothetical protein